MATTTKAQLARELGLSRARVTQLCELGLPVRPDGKLNRAEALEWVKENIDPSRGGWWGDIRPRKNQKAREAGTREGLEGEMTQIDGTLDWSLDYQSLPAYWLGAADIVNALRRPRNVQYIAEMVIAHRCTAAQAYGVAQMYNFLLGIWMADAVAARLGKEHPKVIQLFETEPDWSEIAHIAGEPVDTQAWERETQRQVEEWTARVEIERAKPLR